MGFKGKSISVASYDAGNRLTAWNRAGADENHSQTWNYDDAGNWNSTTKDGDTKSRDHSVSDQITQLDGNPVSHDLKGNLTKYKYGRKNYKVKLQWYHKNYLDHVYAVSDDNGDLVEHYRYTAFGEPEIYRATGTKRNTSAIGNTVMWNTRRYDADNGLYYYKYRHYAANIGRWLGRDPIEEDGGVNLYAFVGNDPINWWDRFGNLGEGGGMTEREAAVAAGTLAKQLGEQWDTKNQDKIKRANKIHKDAGLPFNYSGQEYCGRICEKCVIYLGKKIFIYAYTDPVEGTAPEAVARSNAAKKKAWDLKKKKKSVNGVNHPAQKNKNQDGPNYAGASCSPTKAKR